MAETNFNLNFKYGLSTNLKGLEKNNGTIYVTTDERSMYVDLNGERFRLGDVLMYDTLKDLAADYKGWYKNSLAFVAEKNLLAYYNGTEWVNINDTSELTTTLNNRIAAEEAKRAADDTALGGRIDAEKARAEDVEADLNTAIQGNATEITNIKTVIGTKSDTNQATSIWDAIESLSGNSATSLGSLEAKINQEIADRGAGDTALNGRIDGIISSYETKTDAANKLQAAKDYADAQDVILKGALEGTATDTKDSATIKGAKLYADSLDAAIRLAFGSADSALDERLQAVEAFLKEAELDTDDKNVIDTLKEIQEYIKSDETGASEMLAAINALKAKTKLGTHTVGEEEKEYETVKAYVEDIQRAILVASQEDATAKANAAKTAAEATAQGYANTAKADAISAAAADATKKADDAQAAAISAAATDAADKADAAKNAAITAASADAQTKADAAKNAAIAAAATDATNKANAAQSAAEATAATDATNKANAALASAKTYAEEQAGAAKNAAIATAAADAKSKADTALDSAKTYAEGQANTALGTAKGYAETQASAAQANAISAAATDATNKANAAEANAKNAAAADATAKADAALASAKTYADSKMTWGTF